MELKRSHFTSGLCLLSLIALLGINVMAQWIRKANREQVRMQERLLQQSATMSDLKDFMGSSTFGRLQWEGVSLDRVRLVGDHQDTVPIRNRINGPVLVFRYSELDCGTCVDEQIRILQDFAAKNATLSMVIWASYKDPKHLVWFRKLNKVTIPVYNVVTENTQRNEDIPLYFLTDRDLTVRHVFVPEKKYPELTRKYLELMSSLSARSGS